MSRAIALVETWLHSATDATGQTLSDLADFGLVDLFLALHPEIKTIQPDTGRVWHDLPDDLATYLAGAAQTNFDAYELVMEIVTRNIINGQKLPVAFRTFAFLVLKETFPIPKSRGPKPSRDFALKWMLYEGARSVAAPALEIPLTRNEGSVEISACDAVVEAATRLGYSVSYHYVRDLCVHRDHSKFRERAEPLSNFLKDNFLKRQGLLRDPRKGYFIEWPFRQG